MKTLLFFLLISTSTVAQIPVTIHAVSHDGNPVSITWEDVYGTRFTKEVTNCLTVQTWFNNGDVLRIAYKGKQDKIHVWVTVNGNDVFYDCADKWQMGSASIPIGKQARKSVNKIVNNFCK